MFRWITRWRRRRNNGGTANTSKPEPRRIVVDGRPLSRWNPEYWEHRDHDRRIIELQRQMDEYPEEELPI
jgi:hypothetical protein